MYEQLKQQNLDRWNKVTVNPSNISLLNHISTRLIAAKSKYQSVELETKVPWPVVAVIHERESSQSWIAALAQGDPWNKVSTHTPKGKGPYASWEDAAVAALKDGGLDAWSDWSIEGTLTALEKFNGLGYYNKRIPSPYLWSMTNQYKSGKYVADGKFDSNAVDKQSGCAALFIQMMSLDSSIIETYKWADKVVIPTPINPPVIESVSPKATIIPNRPGFWSSLFNWLFGRKSLTNITVNNTVVQKGTSMSAFLTAIPQLVSILGALQSAITALENSGVTGVFETLLAHITPGQPNSPVLAAPSK